jgi:hypothetical protein
LQLLIIRARRSGLASHATTLGFTSLGTIAQMSQGSGTQCHCKFMTNNVFHFDIALEKSLSLTCFQHFSVARIFDPRSPLFGCLRGTLGQHGGPCQMFGGSHLRMPVLGAGHWKGEYLF